MIITLFKSLFKLGNQTRDTLVEGECSHHSTNPAPQKILKIFSTYYYNNTLLSGVPVNLCLLTSPGSMLSNTVWTFSSVESLLCVSSTRIKNKLLGKTLDSLSAKFGNGINLLSWISVPHMYVFRKKYCSFCNLCSDLQVVLPVLYQHQCTSDTIKLTHFCVKLFFRSLQKVALLSTLVKNYSSMIFP